MSETVYFSHSSEFETSALMGKDVQPAPLAGIVREFRSKLPVVSCEFEYDSASKRTTSLRDEDIYLSRHWGKSIEANKSVSSEILQKWEGIVLDVHEDSFTARLYDQVNKNVEEAEFELEELREEERKLVRSGASFYWTIGYRDDCSGRHNESFIYFRRLLPLSKEELDEIKQRAKVRREKLGW